MRYFNYDDANVINPPIEIQRFIKIYLNYFAKPLVTFACAFYVDLKVLQKKGGSYKSLLLT